MAGVIEVANWQMGTVSCAFQSPLCLLHNLHKCCPAWVRPALDSSLTRASYLSLTYHLSDAPVLTSTARISLAASVSGLYKLVNLHAQEGMDHPFHFSISIFFSTIGKSSLLFPYDKLYVWKAALEPWQSYLPWQLECRHTYSRIFSFFLIDVLWKQCLDVSFSDMLSKILSVH